MTEAATALTKRLNEIRQKPDFDRMLGMIDALDKGPERNLRLGTVRAAGAMAMQLYKQDGKPGSLGGKLALTPAQKKKAREVWASYVDTLEKATGQRFPDEQRPPKE